MYKKKIISLLIKILASAIIAVIAFFLSELIKKPAKIDDAVAKYVTELKAAPNDSDPMQHKPEEVISYVLWKSSNTNKFKVKTTGEVKASIATQKVLNERIVINNQAMLSTISTGLINTGKQRFYSNNKVLIRNYEKLDGINTTWKNENPECVTYNEIINRYGWLPFQANGYIICNETYLNKDKMKIESLDNNLFKISVDLNPDGGYAPFWYRREILTTSNSTIIPDFKYIHIDFTFDKDYRLIYQDFKEAYNVKSIGITALTESILHDEFTYDNIEFNQDYLNYFNGYKDLEPEKTDENTIIPEDNASMIMSSLQNGINDVLLDLNLSINETKLDGNALINISDLKNIKLMLKITDSLELDYLNDNLYLNLYGYKIKATKEEINNIIKAFNLDTTKLDFNNILNDINSGKLTENGNNRKIEFVINLFGNKINVNADIDKIDNGYLLNSINLNLNILNQDINILLKRGNIEFIEKDYSNYSSINDLEKIIDKITNIINKKEFNTKIDISLNNQNGKYLDILGTFKLKLYDNYKFDFELDLNITKYNKNDDIQKHFINIKLISDEYYKTHNINSESMIFINYRTIENSDSILKIKIPLNKVLSIINTITKVLGIQINKLDQYSNYNFENLDLTQIRSLFINLLPKINFNLDLANLIQEIKNDNGKFNLKLKLNNINESLNINISLNDNGNINLGLTDFYIYHYSDIDYLKLDINEISLTDEEISINPNNDEGYYDFSDLDKLLNGIIASTTYKDYSLGLNLDINISLFGSEINEKIPVNAKIKIEDKKPTIYISFNLSGLNLIKSLIKADKLNIYYKDEYVYINRIDSTNDVYDLKIHYKTFLGNIKYYLVEFGMGLTPGIIGGISGSSEKITFDAGQLINGYSYLDNKYNFKIDLKQLLSNDKLGILNFDLILSNINDNLSLSKIEDIKLSVFGLLSVNIDSISLLNLNENKLMEVDMNELNTYVSNYNKNIDIEYKNNEIDKNINHKIKFVLYDKNIEFSDEVNKDIVFPAVENVVVSEKEYTFDGWYIDRELTIKYTNTKVENKDLILYAKYKSVN